jgi:hypothetical protein
MSDGHDSSTSGGTRVAAHSRSRPVRWSVRSVLALAVAMGGLALVVNVVTPSVAGATNDGER